MASLTFGIVAVLCCALAPVAGSAALGLGLTASILARRDLQGMRWGRVDPEGRGPTMDALQRGRSGAILGAVALAAFGALAVLVLVAP